MASLISKASLLMVPSTYEDGTLYNVLPSGNKAPDETGNYNGYDQTRADFTFSRGSNLAATRVNSDGLIEKGRENLLLQSNAFDTTWVDNLGSGGSITSGQEGYDGTNNAWLLTKGATSYRRIQQSVSGVSGVWTMSAYLKAGTANEARFRDNTSAHAVKFDFNNNTSSSAGTNAAIDHKMIDVGDGWFRCSATFNASSSVFQIYVDWNTTTATTLYVQYAQLEKGLVATDYIETGSTTAQAGILEDMPRINYDANGENGALLLESSRTNLVTQSEYMEGYSNNVNITIETNSTTSPEGVQNAVKATPTSANSNHIVRSNNLAGLTSQGTYCVSVFAKQNGYKYISLGAGFGSTATALPTFDLDSGTIVANSSNGTIEDFGNGWYRCTAIIQIASTALYPVVSVLNDSQSGTYIGDGTSSVYFYGHQIEEASYPSSYVPTYGSAVTRSADSCYVDYADAHPNDEGTIFFEVGNYETNASASGFNKILVLNEVSSSNLDNVIYFEEYAGQNTILIRKGGSTLLQSTPNYQDLRGSKIAIKWNSSEAKIFIDGSLNKTYTGDASLSPRYIGYDNPYNGQIVSPLVIKEQFHFNEALSDSECESLTA